MTTKVNVQRIVRAGALGLLASALAVGVGACGSSSSAATTSASTSSSGTRYQARLALAKCLRAHGLNVPDPSPNGGVAGGGGGGFRTLRDQPNFTAAMQACAKYRAAASPFANLTAQQREQFQQDLVKFAECMRAHNVNVPDPTTGGGPGGGFGIFRSIPQSERSSPAFRSAVQACVTNLPLRRGGAGGPPGAVGGAAGAAPGA